MLIQWDYTNASRTYNKRPQYNQKTIDEIIRITQLNKRKNVCDIGAGTGYLSIKLAQVGMPITAIEPNQAMRDLGKTNTKQNTSIKWINAQAENTNQPDNSFDLISFGSSFNVVNRKVALKEAFRIAKPDAYFCAIWNHRDLDNTLQKAIETYIFSQIPEYNYGIRRKNQGMFLAKSQLFSTIHEITHRFTVSQQKDDIINAWKSHQTLIKQAGKKSSEILSGIEYIINSTPTSKVITPYISRCWVAQFDKK